MRSFFLYHPVFFTTLLLMCLVSIAETRATVALEENSALVARGDKAAMAVLIGLKTRLAKALAEKGPVDAMQFCSTQALPLTEEFRKTTEALEVKRTSLRYRNEKNAPDEQEKRILEAWEKLETEKKTLPAYALEKEKDGKVRYYKPLRVEPLCLTCHASSKNLQEHVRTKLNQLYPQDRATGYKAGDFRGVIRITLKP